MNRNTKTILTISLGFIWAGATIVGGRALLQYESSPGKVGPLSKSWPTDSAIQLAHDRPTLLMFAHPQCPCTRASAAELAQVVARTPDKARVFVLFYTPRNSGTEWTNTDLHREVARIPGVEILSDIDGVEARRFGAETSGHTFLFDPSGRLLFNGGITASRGHAGDNIGESTIISFINNHTSSRTQTLVFGCSLRERNQGASCLK